MYHKKSFYRIAAFVAVNDYQGKDSRPVSFPNEFMSSGGCQDFISRNNLDAEWPGTHIPATTGVCVPDCFCAIYRRQIVRHLKTFNIYRAVTLIWFGYERMRRSVAEADLVDTEQPITSKYDIPSGHHYSALKEFTRSLWRNAQHAGH